MQHKCTTAAAQYRVLNSTQFAARRITFLQLRPPAAVGQATNLSGACMLTFCCVQPSCAQYVGASSLAPLNITCVLGCSPTLQRPFPLKCTNQRSLVEVEYSNHLLLSNSRSQRPHSHMPKHPSQDGFWSAQSANEPTPSIYMALYRLNSA